MIIKSNVDIKQKQYIPSYAIKRTKEYYLKKIYYWIHDTQKSLCIGWFIVHPL